MRTKPPNSLARVNPAFSNIKQEFAATRWVANDADGAGCLSGSGRMPLVSAHPEKVVQEELSLQGYVVGLGPPVCSHCETRRVGKIHDKRGNPKKAMNKVGM